MALEAKLKKLKITPEYNIRDLKSEDAEEIVKLFNVIYNGDYPLPEYLDVNWIKAQVGNPNLIFKVFENENQNFLGCGVLDFDPLRGTLCGCRTVIYPEYQGNGIFSGAVMDTARQILKELGEKVKIFYGTSRMVPGQSSMQRILEKSGFKPVAFLLDMDTGVGDRESEMYQAMIFSHAFKKRRKNPVIIPEIEKIICAVKRNFRHIKDYEIKRINKIPNNGSKVVLFETKHKYYTNLTLKCCDNYIKVEINLKSKSASVTKYHCEEKKGFLSLLLNLTKELKRRGIKYLEAYVNAYEPHHQKAFYQASFKIVGYIPSLDTIGKIFEDRVVMIWIPGEIMTRSLEFTPISWRFVKNFLNDLGLKGTYNLTPKGHIKFDLS
ncbi:MAG: GNAT family N-acetyltransferase [Candidatus Helarchaeota archaeon]